VRPIRETDGPGIIGLHARLSERARYFRFFGAYPRIPERDLKRFVTVDHRNREASVAVLDDDLIAVARYERLAASPTDAEIAFLVVDEHQRRGIAPMLLGQLVDAARVEGVVRFVAEVLPANTAMMKVFAGTGFEIEHAYADGVIHVTFPIDAGSISADE
jgi:RimJ/RimL family protein N-acetyltransferase